MSERGVCHMLTTESTTFTKDVMGRWVCNTLTEARDSANPAIHPGARPFDVIIVGSGSFGGMSRPPGRARSFD